MTGMLTWAIAGILLFFGLPVLSGLCYALLLRLGWDPLNIMDDG